jgi:hypothetical protein
MIYTKPMGRKPLGRERINITLPKGMAQALMEDARGDSRDRSELIEELAREYLRKKGVDWKTLVLPSQDAPAKKRKK